MTVRRSGGRIVGLHVGGHAAFAPSGRDIVCAAASALVQTTAYGLRAHCAADIAVEDDREQIYRLDVRRGGGARAQAVLETAVSGLRALARSYPGRVRVRSVAGKPASKQKRSRPARTARKR